MGIVIFIWVVIAIISLFMISHNKKAKEEEQERRRQERERQRREWKELEKQVRQQDREVKKTMRQTQKAMIKAMADDGLAKITAQGEAWHKAMEQAQEEFREKGITDISYQNTDLIKRADEIYNSGTFADIEKESYPKHLKIIEEDKSEEEMAIKPLSGKTYGGYSFSLAQLETVSRLPEKTLETIGITMVNALSARKKKYQIKQDLFMAVINWDAEFFVELAFADCFFLEKPLISAFYHEFEYENEEEARETINKSEYLKHYPELKDEILKDALSISQSGTASENGL